MVQISWTNLAVDDLKSIYEYISKDSVKYAKIQVIKIKVATRILRTQPLAGATVPELNNKIFRQLVEGNYRIIYKIVDRQRIDILAIHHSSRDLLRRQIG